MAGRVLDGPRARRVVIQSCAAKICKRNATIREPVRGGVSGAVAVSVTSSTCGEERILDKHPFLIT